MQDDKLKGKELRAVLPAEAAQGRSLFFTVSIHVVTSLVIAPLLAYLTLFRKEDFFDIVRKSRQKPIRESVFYQDAQLLQRLLQTSAVARSYNQGGLEYQVREGYCANATIRCILKSIEEFDTTNLPPLKSGSSVPSKVRECIDAAASGLTTSSVVYGSEGYERFLETIKKSNDINYRVAVNFLRSPLNGFMSYWLVPFHFLLGLMGGHFSPVLGFLEEEDLVAVFDVNHSYGGVYFVKSKRLFDAVNTVDLSVTKSRITRGLVLTQVSTAKPAKN